jgi:hypothetical protein
MGYAEVILCLRRASEKIYRCCSPAPYEAVAHGSQRSAATSGSRGIAQGLNVVRVSVADVRVEHEVKLMDFTKWLDRTGGSPREVSDRQRIRSILGCRFLDEDIRWRYNRLAISGV